MQFPIQTRRKNSVRNIEMRPPYTCTMWCMRPLFIILYERDHMNT